jgi:hypothetical protein
MHMTLGYITLFISITRLRGIDNIPQNILEYSPHPANIPWNIVIVMDLKNVM